MQEKISARVASLTPSAPFAMAAKSAAMKAQGIDVINMAVGEPDFDTPEYIREASKKAVDDGFTRYSPVPGYMSLREAVCAKLLKENGLEYSPSEILVSGGAKQCISETLLTLVDAGEEVIIPAPYWVSYPQMAKLVGGVPVHVTSSIEDNFKIKPEHLEKAITPRTRVVILCSPCNPSGSVYTSGELEALAQVIMRHEGVFVISDEIYEHLNYGGSHSSIASVPGMRERTIVINGVSKAYAMTGWRIGYLAAPEWIVKAVSKLQGQLSSGVCSVSQKAAESALRQDWDGGSQRCVEKMRSAFARRRDLIVSLAREIPGLEVNVPSGAFYLFPKCSSYFGRSYDRDGVRRTISNADDFAMYLLEVGHVATIGGTDFGAPDCFRMSYALSEADIREALRRIKTALSQIG